MNNPATTELLSAYIDGELDAEEYVRVEKLLAEDPAARATYAALRQVASGLKLIERQAPPPSLDLVHMKRLTRMDRRNSFFFRLADQFRAMGQHSKLAAAFAMLLIFGVTVSSRMAVIHNDPASAYMWNSTAVISGNVYVQEGEVWFQNGMHTASSERPVDISSGEGRQLLAQKPDLREITQLGEVVLEVDGEMLRLINRGL
jgi:anti-sigma factor RsiW